MIKRDYSVASVVDFLIEDMSDEMSGKEIAAYSRLLMETMNFTMPYDSMVELTDAWLEGRSNQWNINNEVEFELPFKQIYIELTDGQKSAPQGDVERFGLFIIHNPSGMTFLPTVFYTDGTQLCPCMMITKEFGISDMRAVMASRVQGDAMDFVKREITRLVQRAMAVMYLLTQHKEVVQEYVPMSVRRNKRRGGKGKIKHKLLEYKVLRVDLNKSKSVMEGGGTHASPRLHLRRGHWRHYKSGKKRWIKPMWVGDKDLGVIHKDYELHT